MLSVRWVEKFGTYGIAMTLTLALLELAVACRAAIDLVFSIPESSWLFAFRVFVGVFYLFFLGLCNSSNRPLSLAKSRLLGVTSLEIRKVLINVELVGGIAVRVESEFANGSSKPLNLELAGIEFLRKEGLIA